MPALNQSGRDVDDVIDELAAKRHDDVKWEDGRAFGMVYNGGPGVHEVAERAAAMYLHENALNTKAFPSLGSIQSEVVGWTASLLNGPETAAGFLTSGGTESILCGVKAARERGRAERGIDAPEMIVAESAHAAFHKGAHLFGLTRATRRRCVDDYTADVDAMAELVGENTALVVGSAPQYPQGVVDDIPRDRGAGYASVGASCHVDACMGGFVLPFAEMLGRDVPPWDFRVDGVTTISADIHKLGYAPKGVSVILHRTKDLRRYQTFVFDDWLGGFYASPNLQGTRSGLADGGRLGGHAVPGRRRLRRPDSRQTLANADQMRAGIAADRRHPRARRRAVPPDRDGGTTPTAEPDRRCSRSPTRSSARGWFHDRQTPPDSLHSTVSNSNTGVIAEYLDAAGRVRRSTRCGATTTDDRSTNYATLE